MREEKLSTATLIVGIMSCVLCCACLGLPLGIVGIVLFILSTGNGHGVNDKAGFGLVLSIIGILLSLVMAVFLIMAHTNKNRYYNDYYDYDYGDGDRDFFDDYDYDDGYDNYYDDYEEGYTENDFL